MSGSDRAVSVRTIHAGHQHMTWDNAREPAATVAPGETVAFAEVDAVCGQIAPDSGVEAIANLDFDRVNPIAGPIYVDGAEPGDTHQGDPGRPHAVGLGMDRHRPGLRPAGGGFSGAFAPHLVLRHELSHACGLFEHRARAA